MNKVEQFYDKNGKWEFNEDVALEFENMLTKSIPQYEVMRNLIYDIGCGFISLGDKTAILDLGCSDGLNLKKFVSKYGATRTFKGIDISEPMLQLAKTRFEGMINAGVVEICNMDLRYEFPMGSFSLIMSILTLQFIPIEYRQFILQNVYDNLKNGSAFIMVEKVLGNTYDINKILVDNYYKLKNKNGYSYDEINRKRQSLEGVLVPMTSEWNKDMLKQAGFKKVDTFWRYLNFEGYLAIK